jgi:hypothetical protein
VEDFAQKDKQFQFTNQHGITTASCCCLPTCFSTCAEWCFRVERAGTLLAVKKPSVEIGAFLLVSWLLALTTTDGDLWQQVTRSCIRWPTWTACKCLACVLLLNYSTFVLTGSTPFLHANWPLLSNMHLVNRTDQKLGQESFHLRLISWVSQAGHCALHSTCNKLLCKSRTNL